MYAERGHGGLALFSHGRERGNVLASQSLPGRHPDGWWLAKARQAGGAKAVSLCDVLVTVTLVCGSVTV